MSTTNLATPPQVMVRTPRGIGWLQHIWRLGDTWMSTVDHADRDQTETIQLYPLEQLGPARTDKLNPQRSHVVRRAARRSRILPRLIGIALLAASVAAVGFAWLAGLGV